MAVAMGMDEHGKPKRVAMSSVIRAIAVDLDFSALLAVRYELDASVVGFPTM